MFVDPFGNDEPLCLVGRVCVLFECTPICAAKTRLSSLEPVRSFVLPDGYSLT